jgi:glutamine synthetase
MAIYEPPVDRPTVPFSLPEALDALEADSYLRSCVGEQFVQAFTAQKRDEARRFALAVTDWELREYVDPL